YIRLSKEILEAEVKRRQEAQVTADQQQIAAAAPQQGTGMPDVAQGPPVPAEADLPCITIPEADDSADVSAPFNDQSEPVSMAETVPVVTQVVEPAQVADHGD